MPASTTDKEGAGRTRLQSDLHSVVSVLVSFAPSHPATVAAIGGSRESPQPVATHHEPDTEDLESVLGATPRGFESRILRCL